MAQILKDITKVTYKYTTKNNSLSKSLLFVRYMMPPMKRDQRQSILNNLDIIKQIFIYSYIFFASGWIEVKFEIIPKILNSIVLFDKSKCFGKNALTGQMNYTYTILNKNLKL